MDELLVYPTTDVRKAEKKEEAAINSKAVLITDSEILDKLKQEKTEKEALERKAKALEKEQKKKMKVLE